MPSKQITFEGMTAEEIALQVEQDIRSLARKYRRKEGRKPRAQLAATATAALYLQNHHALYFRDDKQAMKDAHQRWMILMQEWFLSELEPKKTMGA